MRYQLISNAQDIALEVTKVYLDAVKAYEVLSLSENNLATHKKIYSDIRKRVESAFAAISNAIADESTAWKPPSKSSTSTSSVGKPASTPLSIMPAKPFSTAGQNSLGTLPPTTTELNLKPEPGSPGLIR